MACIGQLVIHSESENYLVADANIHSLWEDMSQVNAIAKKPNKLYLILGSKYTFVWDINNSVYYYICTEALSIYESIDYIFIL